MLKRPAARCFVAMLCLGLGAAAFADASTQPAVPQAKPFRAFVEAIKAGDADAFRDCQSKVTRESKQPWQEKLAEAKGSLHERYGDYDIARFTYAFVADDGDDTRGVLTIGYPDRSSIPLKVVKEGADWKLASH